MMREDWVEVELGELLKLNNGYAFKSSMYTSAGVPIIRISDINNGIIELDKAVKVEQNDEYEKYSLEYGDILIAMSGATTGKFGMYRLNKKAYQNQRVGNFKIHSESIMFKNFLYYLLFFLKEEILEKAYGGAQPNISSKKIEGIKIWLPSMPEQRAIVAKIEELFSELDSGIDSLNKAKKKLEVYRQAVLKAAFEGKLTKEWRMKNQYSMVSYLNKLQKIKAEAIKDKLISKSDYFPEFNEEELTYKCPDDWIHLPFKTITKNNRYSLKRGPFGSSLKKEFFVEKGIPVYEQANAINDEPYNHRYFITEEKFNELKAFEVTGGDMIVSCSGTLGRISLLPDNVERGVINQALLKIDIDEEIVLKKYFILLFRSGTFQTLLFKKSIGTAMRNMVGMNELKEIPIPIPSIEEQEQIIKEIESRLSVCENIEANIEEAFEKAEALRHSILKKAFEGKLLSKEELEVCKQEDDWEPSEKLLKRIKEATKEVK